jgi:hypothetical protein
MKAAGKDDGKAVTRIVAFLANGNATVGRSSVPDKALLDGGERGMVAASNALLKQLASDGIVERQGRSLSLTEAGRRFLRRHLGDRGDYASQHRDLEHRRIEVPGGVQEATVNLAESPLAQLARRKDRSGRPFLSASEWQAGERLRADYTRGQIMPRMGANWEASVSSGRRAGGIGDLTDAALAARLRVEGAIDAVGPELHGVLIDVCCFLKGMEQVESERGWPARSGKLMLKAALGVLARHYDPAPRKQSRASIVHWGTKDYRPAMAP